MDFLEEQLTSPRGYAAKTGKPTTGQIPVALTDDGQVIFGTEKMPYSTAKKLKLVKYDDEVERQRRLLAETVLAQIVLEKPAFTKLGVGLVSRAIKEYWQSKKRQLEDKDVVSVMEGSTRYLYGKTSFGRFNDKVPSSQNMAAEVSKLKLLIEGWIATMSADPLDLPKIMNVHDHFLRLFLRILGPTDKPLGKEEGNEINWASSPQYSRYKIAYGTFRPKWYEDTKERGRVPAAKPSGTTSMPGLITTDFTIPMVGSFERCGLDLLDLKLEDHARGRDGVVINATVMNSVFRDSLSDFNLPFSASASGTTSTLFMSARTFGSISNMEDLKQYLLGCVAYLVGGGMHTCHEVFWTGKLVGIPYQTGKYTETLPKSLTSSREYDRWSQEFWEFARPDRATVM